METMRLSMAQALVKFLNNQFIEFDGQEYKFIKGIMGIFGLSGFGGTVDSLYKEIQNMAQAHDRVMEGLDLQANGIPLTFRKEIMYEH